MYQTNIIFKNPCICSFLGFWYLETVFPLLRSPIFSFKKCSYVILFYPFGAFIWCVTHAYSPYLKNYPKLGGLGKLGHPKIGGQFRFDFGPPSNIVTHHPKSICTNFGACITTCRYWSLFVQEQSKYLSKNQVA